MQKGTLVLQYDAPDEADAWFHGPHYTELLTVVPGVVAVRRYKLASATDPWPKYLVIIESADIDATLAWRKSAEGKLSQDDATRHGLRNRASAVYHCIFSSVPKSN